MESADNQRTRQQRGHKDCPTHRSMLYGIEERPPLLQCLFFGLQQAVICIGTTMSIPFILSELLCTGGNNEVTARLLSITMFMCGVATLLQTVFGIRLGVIQGGSHMFIPPIVAMMAVDKWKCYDSGPEQNITNNDDWKERMREIQGNFILASVVKLLLGCTGIVGFVLQFVGPLTVAPTISLIGLSLTGIVAEFNKIHWGVASLAMGLTLIFSLYLRRIYAKFPAWSSEKRCHTAEFQVFQLFPAILSICVSWLFCFVLTVANVLPDNSTLPSYMARTDARIEVLKGAPWFYWPYPFQFGTPTVSSAGFFAFFVVSLFSVIESVGEYYAAARISGALPPPPYAINRGIAVGGISDIVSGLVGSGHGTTVYIGNIGAIGITKVASRAVFFAAGVILLICGVAGKVGAVLTLIPDPVIGGTLTVVFGMVCAVGISTLKFIDMDSTRNLTILGISLLLGLMVPQYVNDPSNVHVINTGNQEADQVIKVLLGTAMFVGGFVGCFLDNTVPGSDEERGLIAWRKSLSISTADLNTEQSLKLYEYPYLTRYIQRIKCCSYFPVSPTYNKTVECKCCSKKKIEADWEKESYDNHVASDDIEIVVNSTENEFVDKL